MATSLKNTVKWGISSSIFNNMAGSIQKAWSYTKNLDASLNDIRIVTGKSADEMERFAKQAAFLEDNKDVAIVGAWHKEFPKTRTGEPLFALNVISLPRYIPALYK